MSVHPYSGIKFSDMKQGGRGFPGGSVVKNPPANVGDTGSIPDLGRSHMMQSNQAHEPQLLSLSSTAQEPQLLKLACPGARQQEKAPQSEVCAL